MKLPRMRLRPKFQRTKLKTGTRATAERRGSLSVYEELAEGSLRPLTSFNYRDIPRLIKRCVFETPSGTVFSPIHNTGSTEELLIDAIVSVAAHFEGANISAALRTDLKSCPVDQEVDLEDFTEAAFVKLSAVSPVSCAVFKQLHQGIVLCGMQKLKQTVLQAHVTKDVRDASGWSVTVWLGTDRVVVTHTRRERAVDFTDMTNHWDLLWEVSETFDANMERMTAAFVRIVGVDFSHFHNGTSAARSQITSKLPAGLIVG